MNCQISQRRMLLEENPASPPLEVQAHLEHCIICQEWQRQLLRIEKNVPRLPVPSTSARDQIIHQLLSFPLQVKDGDLEVENLKSDQTRIDRTKERKSWGGFQKIIPSLSNHLARQERFRLGLAGLAASLMVVVSWWTLWQPNQNPALLVEKAPPPDPLVAKLVQRDLGLAEAISARQRVQVFADIAEDLETETRRLIRVAGIEDLRHLARLYQLVVRDGLVKQGQILSSQEQLLVLGPIGDRLNRTGLEADALAQDVPAASVPLRQIAEVAKMGGKQFKQSAKIPTDRVVVPLSPPIDDRRLRHLVSNRGLVQSLVDGSLNLANARDSLQRADCCNKLAESLADEIKKAAENKDGNRANELGRHYQALLERGVAGNLIIARGEIPPDSSRYHELKELGKRVGQVELPVENQLKQATNINPEEMRPALKAVKGGWEEVEKSLRLNNPPSGPNGPD